MAWRANDDEDNCVALVVGGSKSEERLVSRIVYSLLLYGVHMIIVINLKDMDLDDVIELAFNNNDVTRGSIANVIVKSFRFLNEDGGAVDVIEHMAGLQSTSRATTEAFVSVYAAPSLIKQ